METEKDGSVPDLEIKLGIFTQPGIYIASTKDHFCPNRFEAMDCLGIKY